MLQRSEQFTSSKLLKLQIIKKETRNEYHLYKCPAAVRVGGDWGSSSVAVDQGLRNNHLSLNLWELESVVPAAAAPMIGRGINAPVVGCLASI